MEPDEIAYLWTNSLFASSHKKFNDYANSWVISPEYIKKNLDRKYYKLNSDGSIDFELILYFKTQSYFYLGLIVSGTTLVVFPNSK